MYAALIVLPMFFAVVALINQTQFKNITSLFFLSILAFLSMTQFYFYDGVIQATLSDSFKLFFIFVDTLLLLYFLLQGILNKQLLVSLLAVAQLILYATLLCLHETLSSSDLLVDKVSTLMYLIINLVGGLIILYSLKYIESEEVSLFKKRYFIALEFFFLGVMNFLVSTNNIEIFFMLFELTTLCSYLLIGYRGDTIANKNALLALWMNQIGGIAILLALLVSLLKYDTIYFDILMNSVTDLYLFPIALLALAAFVKGASLPFENWLLGAMVAPTPVSALLHSATMVKIAPFLMLKIAPAMSESLSLTITLFSSFVFFAASLMALAKDYFKEILGLSTIALLALMMALASIGTPEAIMACLTLMAFHALSKALLFLQAGVLEKSFGLKYMKDINGLINQSPLVVFFIVLGFASLTLPPFGAFIAKFMAIESIANLIYTNPLYIVVLIFIALGSVFLTLLYFKVLTKLFAKDAGKKEILKVKISRYYSLPSFALVALLILGVLVSYQMRLLNSIEMIVPSIFLLSLIFLFSSLLFKNAQRVKEYHCGEKEELHLNMYYFEIPQLYKRVIHLIAITLIIIILVGVMI